MDKQPQVPSQACRQTSSVPQPAQNVFQNTATPTTAEIRNTPSLTMDSLPLAVAVERKQNIALLLACAFFAGAFTGVVVESLWCLIKFQTLERRSGLLFFPIFNPVYGAGAIVLTLIGGLNGEQRSSKRIFLISMVSGSALEYIFSFVQEMATGSVSWDYSAAPLNIGGRIHLLYCIAWGLLGLLWVKVLLPPLDHLARKLDTRLGRRIMLVATVMLCLDLAVSGLAIFRWSERTQGVAGHSALATYYDQRYPDSVMKHYYPNLKFVSDKH